MLINSPWNYIEEVTGQYLQTHVSVESLGITSVIVKEGLVSDLAWLQDPALGDGKMWEMICSSAGERHSEICALFKREAGRDASVALS